MSTVVTPTHPRARVGILIETFAGYQRDMIAGISRFVRQERPAWEFLFQPRPDQLRDKMRWMTELGGLIVNQVDHHRRVLRWVRKLKCPTVFIEHYGVGVPVVQADNAAIGRMAFEHLRSKGLRRFGFWHLEGIRVFEQRKQAFEQAVREAGQHLHSCPPVLADRMIPGRVQHRELCQWLADAPRPIGLLVPNVDYARRVVIACDQLGLDVPQEVAVLGVDRDELVCELATPPVSVIDHGMVQAGYEAAALLNRLLKGKKAPPGPVVVPPVGVVERQSTDTVAVDNADVRDAVRVIRERAMEGLQVKQLLAEIPVARRTLELGFRRHLGRSVRGEIQRVRISRARQLLLETDLSVAQIAEMCGYTYASRLAEAFSREEGEPPIEYRRRFRQTG